jgi:hypothetical protein
MDQPAEVEKIYNDALLACASGMATDDANEYAWRQVHLAGWYESPAGWAKLTDDLRDKVNIRKAVKQKDGKHAIYDVDVFYPNAVKGRAYTPEEIDSITTNTNGAINAGGQPAQIADGHPNPNSGESPKSYGRVVNWRPSPRGNGWVRSDFIDIDDDFYSEKMAKRQVGLSVGLYSDHAGTNKRFGHVAVLGADSQALSHLPALEVYQSDCVFFAAETPVDGDNIMDEMDDMYAAMKSLVGCYEACKMAKDAKEPTYAAKMDELKKKGDDFKAKYFGSKMESAEMKKDEKEAEGKFASPKADAVVTITEGAKEMPVVTPKIEIKEHGMDNDIASKFSAALDDLKAQVAELTKQKAENEKKVLRDSFSATVAEIAKTKQVDADKYVEKFTALGETSEVFSSLIDLAKTAPAKPVGSDEDAVLGSYFTASVASSKDAEVTPIAKQKSDAQVLQTLTGSGMSKDLVSFAAEIV